MRMYNNNVKLEIVLEIYTSVLYAVKTRPTGLTCIVQMASSFPGKEPQPSAKFW